MEFTAGRKTSALGLGLAGFGPRLSERRKQRLLDTAYDAGVTHFDVARAYGRGDAERMLGDWLETRRPVVTVTTKFGLRVAPLSSLSRLATAIVRVARGGAGTRAGMKPEYGPNPFDPVAARASLRDSLTMLRATRVDALLLHECAAEDWLRDDLCAELRRWVTEGVVGAVGIATSSETASTLLREDPSDLLAVVQVAAGADEGLLGDARAVHRIVVTHSAILPALRTITAHLVDEGTARRWSQTVDANCADARVVAKLLLQQALDANPDGIVLFASSKPERVADYAAIGTERAFAPGQVRALEGLVRAELRDAHRARQRGLEGDDVSA